MKTVHSQNNNGVQLKKNAKEKAPLRVVLVDDDPVYCKIASALAEKENISLRYFVSPREAYHSLPEQEYDAAIIDSNLGIVSGFQLCHYLARLGKRNPVIMISATDKAKHPDASFTVKDYIPKSEGLKAIFDSVRRAAMA